jgi:NADPH2:quinone reductase
VTRMQAIVQRVFGGPERLVLEEVPDPEPGEGQVRIAVEAAGVHLLDTSIRKGDSGGPMPLPELPMTPGREVAGTVDRLGRGVDPDWLGRRVVAHLGFASGGYASLAVTDVPALIAVADHVSATDAVAMVGTGRTALGILEVADATAADVAVVTSAAGGLGALLVQALKRAGATVVGAVGTAAKVPVVERLGADVVVDYSSPDWTDQARTALGGSEITLAFDAVGGAAGRATFELVAPGGRMVLYGYSSGAPTPLDAADLFARGVTVTAAVGPRMLSRPGGIRELAEQALGELAAGRLQPLVHPPFPLADAAGAHRALESRATTGKVVLVP